MTSLLNDMFPQVKQEVPPGALHMMQLEIANLAKTVEELRRDEEEDRKRDGAGGGVDRAKVTRSPIIMPQKN